MPSVGEVSAFIGPLLVGIGLIGSFVAWAMARANRRLKDSFDNFGKLNDARMTLMQGQIENQGKLLDRLIAITDQQQKQAMDTATTVARIEGRMTGAKDGV